MDNEIKTCLYCNKEKGISEFSEEHVIPQAIGGNLSPTNPFKTSDVCRRCNNTCGSFVDAAFIKNWFTQFSISEVALKRTGFSQKAVFPLNYLGPAPELEFEGQVCELWLGPTGDLIYHFHKPYPEVKNMPIIVGPAPVVREESDAGFAFIFVAASNSEWWVPVLRSFASQFIKSECYLGNGPCPGKPFLDVPERLLGLQAKLSEMRSEEHHAQLVLSLGYETRFLAKVALGIGHLFLDKAFSASEAADLLRSMLWATTTEERENIPVRGRGAFSLNNHPLAQVFKWSYGHVVALIPSPAGICLYLSIYDQPTGAFLISKEKAHWKPSIPEEGVVYLISPVLCKFIGPLSIPSFIAHRNGEQSSVALKALEDEIEHLPEWPPFHVAEE